MNDLIETIQQIWLGWGQAIIMLIASAEVWRLSRAKSQIEICKLQAETGALRMSQFEKIAEISKSPYGIHGIAARMHEQRHMLLSAVQRCDAAAATSAREAVSKMFLEYITSYSGHAKLSRLISLEAGHVLAHDEMLPFLETSAMIVGVLNQPNVLSLTGQSPLKVNGFDFNFAFRFVRQHTRLWERRRQRQLAGLKRELGI